MTRQASGRNQVAAVAKYPAAARRRRRHLIGSNVTSRRRAAEALAATAAALHWPPIGCRLRDSPQLARRRRRRRRPQGDEAADGSPTRGAFRLTRAASKSMCLAQHCFAPAARHVRAALCVFVRLRAQLRCLNTIRLQKSSSHLRRWPAPLFGILRIGRTHIVSSATNSCPNKAASAVLY